MLLFYSRINLCRARHRLLLLLYLGIFCTVSNTVFGQVPREGDYRTRQTTAAWNDADAWQIMKTGAWTNTSQLPTSSDNIYVQSGHMMIVNGTVTCRDINIHNSGVLDVYLGTLNMNGKIRAYTGTRITTEGPTGTFYSSQTSSVNPTALSLRGQVSTMNIIGFSRNITEAGEWGASNTGTGVSIKVTMMAGNTATFNTDMSAATMELITGNVNMGANSFYAERTDASIPGLLINSGTTFTSSNTGPGAGNCVYARNGTTAASLLRLTGRLVLTGASPYIQAQSVHMNPGAVVEYSATGNQNFANASFTGAVAVSTYRDLILAGSGTKTPVGNFNVKEDITISGSAVLAMGSRTANITGNWISYGQAGLTEGTSTINFDSTGAQTINTTGGENFYMLQKSNTGTLTLASNISIVAGGNLTMQSGVIDANANTFSGTATSALNMSGGTLRLAKLNTTLPEFTITPYNITGGTIELDGAGIQTLRGARNYRNLTFSNSGTKGISSAVNNITGTVTVSGSVVLDVLNNTLGGTGTSLTMTGTSLYRTAGSSQVKPDAAGTYTLGSATTIEFNNNLTGLQSIRLLGASTVNYAHIIVSGSSVGTASLGTGIRFQTGGSFTVKNGATFRHINSTGFSGGSATAINNTNLPAIYLEQGSTIDYNGDGQVITSQNIALPTNANYEGLLLSGTGIKIAQSSTITIKGNLAKTGTTTLNHNGGTIVMNGTVPQSYSSDYPYITFNNFTNNNIADLSVNSEMKVVQALSFGANSKLNLRTGSNIILASSNTATANVGIIPADATIGYFGTGRFTVERFIPTGVSHGRSWQFLAVPTNGGQTINQAWQDTATAANQSRYAGYGTQITSNILPLPAKFDVYTQPGPSMKVYNAAGNNFTGIANTTSLPVYNAKGYMIFVRGDRTITASSTPANSTILRTSGRIFHPVSNIPPVINIGASQFESVGNPYASAINFSNDAAVIKSANVQKVFYVWDPKLGGNLGFGAYQVFTKGVGADNNYYVTPGGGSYGASGSINNMIQSGQAFFVKTVGGTGTLTFTENAKVSNDANTFRPTPPGIPLPHLRCNLSVIQGNSTIMIDGVLNEFGRTLANSIDELDVQKMANNSESMSIRFANLDLSVERRGIPQPNDTIYYRIALLKTRLYELEFNLAGIDDRQVYLEDRFRGTKSRIYQGTTKVSFDVVNEPGSYAPDRFRVVFKSETNCSDMNVFAKTLSDQSFDVMNTNLQ